MDKKKQAEHFRVRPAFLFHDYFSIFSIGLSCKSMDLSFNP